MSKRGGGLNRVCFPCRKKYPSKFTCDSATFNVTSVCSECSKELTTIPDSIRVPKVNQIGRWRKLEQQYFANSLITPACSSNLSLRHRKLYPEHQKVDTKVHFRQVRNKVQEKFYNLYSNDPVFVTQTLRLLFSNVDIHLLIEETDEKKDRKKGLELRSKLHSISHYFDWYRRDCEKILNTPKTK